MFGKIEPGCLAVVIDPCPENFGTTVKVKELASEPCGCEGNPEYNCVCKGSPIWVVDKPLMWDQGVFNEKTQEWEFSPGFIPECLERFLMRIDGGNPDEVEKEESINDIFEELTV